MTDRTGAFGLSLQTKNVHYKHSHECTGTRAYKRCRHTQIHVVQQPQADKQAEKTGPARVDGCEPVCPLRWRGAVLAGQDGVASHVGVPGAAAPVGLVWQGAAWA